MNQGNNTITTAPVYTTINPSPSSITLSDEFNYTSNRFGYYQLCDTAEVHLIAKYYISINLPNLNLANLAQQNPHINFNITPVTLPGSLYSGNIINVAQRFSNNSNLPVFTWGNPAIPAMINNTNAILPLGTISNSFYSVQFEVTVDWGRTMSNNLDNFYHLFESYFTLEGIGLNGTITPITRRTQRPINFLPIETPLYCDSVPPLHTQFDLMYNSPILIGCLDNIFTSRYGHETCSPVKRIEYDLPIPPNMSIHGIQFISNKNHYAITPQISAIVYDYNNNPITLNPSYIQSTFTLFSLPQNNVTIPIQRIKLFGDNLNVLNIANNDTVKFLNGELRVSFVLNQNFSPGLHNMVLTTMVDVQDSCDNIYRKTKSDTLDFLAKNAEPRFCLWKANCDPSRIYNSALVAANGTTQYPGDTIKFAAVVMNTGSVPLNNAFIEDLLPEGLNYVPGSARLYVIPVGQNIDLCNATLNLGTVIHPIISIDQATGRELIRFDFTQPLTGNCIDEAYFGESCQNVTTRYGIVFDVVAGVETPAGTNSNTYTLGGINSNNGQIMLFNSRPAGFNIASRVSTTISKSIIHNGLSVNSLSTTPGSNISYKLKYTNISNFNMRNVTIIDLLPNNNGANDGLILNRNTSRGSTFPIRVTNLLGCNSINT